MTGGTGAARPLANLRDLLSPKPRDHGGTGTILAHRIFARGEGAGAGFIDLAVLPPGTSIGRHRHGHDRETYVVLSGSGVMYRDGEAFRVEAGDVVPNEPFGEHGLSNDTDTELALLVFEVEADDRRDPHGDPAR
ncbi:cupin domain-containing protein [Streptomyces globisporus]|uniref:cupin domain-containing protein n=1 Tax=Streptomyces globisporus TaxID=1908 RepID=UPI00068ED57B|nr:cupin domain-containing protein [Streptomyces globisporus]